MISLQCNNKLKAKNYVSGKYKNIQNVKHVKKCILYNYMF